MSQESIVYFRIGIARGRAHSGNFYFHFRPELMNEGKQLRRFCQASGRNSDFRPMTVPL
jgi:hypothetical protein